jgi:hypothetical protein
MHAILCVLRVCIHLCLTVDAEVHLHLWCLKVRRRGFNITLGHLRPGLAQSGRHHFVPARTRTHQFSQQLHTLSKLNMGCDLDRREPVPICGSWGWE